MTFLRSRQLSALFFFLALVLSGCEGTDIQLATESTVDVVRAATLTDAEVQELAESAARAADARHTLAPPGNPYRRRLEGLVGSHLEEDGVRFNFGVYLAPEVNAFAMADGTIRIYSGLMDMMDDGELRFVVGHEMGHVVEKHIKKKLMLAYAGRAVRKGIASQEGAAGDIARSALGGLLEQLLNAQFSQQEEREADSYGLGFLQTKGYEPRAAVSALGKLAGLGANHSFLASHPAPEARALRLQAMLEAPQPQKETPVAEKSASRFVSFFRSLLLLFIELLQRLTDLLSGGEA